MKKISAKNISSITILGQNSINEDLFNKVEHLTLSELLDEKVTHTDDLTKSEIELNRLQSDLRTFKIKAKLRETELRNYIFHLSEKLQIRDVNKLKGSLSNLQEEILDNISNIQEKTRDEIIFRKNEIQTRTQIRMMDTDVTHTNVMGNKVDGQNQFYKKLNDHTREMERINNNYDHIKKKVELLTKKNDGYKIMINEIEMKNAQIKIELSEVKKMSNYFKIKIENKKHEEHKNKNINNLANIKKESITNLFSLKEVAENLESNNNLKENLLPNNHSPINFKNIKIDKIMNLLNNEYFLKSNPRSSAIISSLANIYENTKIKIRKLKKEIENNKSNSELTFRVIEVLSNSKFNLQTPSIKSLVNRSKSHFLLFKNEFYLNSEQRIQFVDTILNNPNIKNLIENDKLPNIAAIDRQLNYIK